MVYGIKFFDINTISLSLSIDDVLPFVKVRDSIFGFWKPGSYYSAEVFELNTNFDKDCDYSKSDLPNNITVSYIFKLDGIYSFKKPINNVHIRRRM